MTGPGTPRRAPRIAIMGHVGVGNMGDEAITGAVVGRLREFAPDASLVAFSLNPRDTAARHAIESQPLRLYTERLLHAPPTELLFQKMIQRNGAFQRAVLTTAMPLVGLSARLPFRFTLPLLVGGKTPPVPR